MDRKLLQAFGSAFASARVYFIKSRDLLTKSDATLRYSMRQVVNQSCIATRTCLTCENHSTDLAHCYDRVFNAGPEIDIKPESLMTKPMMEGSLLQPCLAHVGVVIMSSCPYSGWYCSIASFHTSCMTPQRLHFGHSSTANCSFGRPAEFPQRTAIPMPLAVAQGAGIDCVGR